jgi:enoyl-CoA hydratase/carnithine racemase
MADFTVQIKTGGTFTCSEAPGQNSQGIYVLSFDSPPDNRVTLPFIDAFVLSLKILEDKTRGRGVLIITSGISKFFSNGFDLEHTSSHEDFFERCIDLLKQILM